MKSRKFNKSDAGFVATPAMSRSGLLKVIGSYTGTTDTRYRIICTESNGALQTRFRWQKVNVETGTFFNETIEHSSNNQDWVDDPYFTANGSTYTLDSSGANQWIYVDRGGGDGTGSTIQVSGYATPTASTGPKTAELTFNTSGVSSNAPSDGSPWTLKWNTDKKIVVGTYLCVVNVTTVTSGSIGISVNGEDIVNDAGNKKLTKATRYSKIVTISSEVPSSEASKMLFIKHYEPSATRVDFVHFYRLDGTASTNSGYWSEEIPVSDDDTYNTLETSSSWDPGQAYELEHGVKIYFTSLTGLKVGDAWTFPVSAGINIDASEMKMIDVKGRKNLIYLEDNKIKMLNDMYNEASDWYDVELTDDTFPVGADTKPDMQTRNNVAYIAGGKDSEVYYVGVPNTNQFGRKQKDVVVTSASLDPMNANHPPFERVVHFAENTSSTGPVEYEVKDGTDSSYVGYRNKTLYQVDHAGNVKSILRLGLKILSISPEYIGDGTNGIAQTSTTAQASLKGLNKFSDLWVLCESQDNNILCRIYKVNIDTGYTTPMTYVESHGIHYKWAVEYPDGFPMDMKIGDILYYDNALFLGAIALDSEVGVASSSTGFVYRVRGFIAGDHGAGTDDANNYGIVKAKGTRLDGTAYTSTSVPSNNDWEIIPSSHVVDITPKIFNGTTEVGDFVKYEYKTKWSVKQHSNEVAKDYGWLEYSDEGIQDMKIRPIVDPSEEFEFFPARYPLGVWNQRYNDVETDALWRHSRIGYCVRIASKTGAQSMEETVNMKMPSKQFTLNVPRPDEIKTPGVDGVTAWQSGTITDEDGDTNNIWYFGGNEPTSLWRNEDIPMHQVPWNQRGSVNGVNKWTFNGGRIYLMRSDSTVPTNVTIVWEFEGVTDPIGITAIDPEQMPDPYTVGTITNNLVPNYSPGSTAQIAVGTTNTIKLGDSSENVTLPGHYSTVTSEMPALYRGPDKIDHTKARLYNLNTVILAFNANGNLGDDCIKTCIGTAEGNDTNSHLYPSDFFTEIPHNIIPNNGTFNIVDSRWISSVSNHWLQYSSGSADTMRHVIGNTSTLAFTFDAIDTYAGVIKVNSTYHVKFDVLPGNPAITGVLAGKIDSIHIGGLERYTTDITALGSYTFEIDTNTSIPNAKEIIKFVPDDDFDVCLTNISVIAKYENNDQNTINDQLSEAWSGTPAFTKDVISWAGRDHDFFKQASGDVTTIHATEPIDTKDGKSGDLYVGSGLFPRGVDITFHGDSNIYNYDVEDASAATRKSGLYEANYEGGAGNGTHNAGEYDDSYNYDRGDSSVNNRYLHINKSDGAAYLWNLFTSTIHCLGKPTHIQPTGSEDGVVLGHYGSLQEHAITTGAEDQTGATSSVVVNTVKSTPWTDPVTIGFGVFGPTVNATNIANYDWALDNMHHKIDYSSGINLTVANDTQMTDSLKSFLLPATTNKYFRKFYNWSLVYDGYQDSPLPTGTMLPGKNYVADQDSTATNGGKRVLVTVDVAQSYLSPRVSGINVWRAYSVSGNYKRLISPQTGQAVQINGTHATGATTLVLDTTKGLTVGDIIKFSSNASPTVSLDETMKITAITDATDIVVTRAHNGETAQEITDNYYLYVDTTDEPELEWRLLKTIPLNHPDWIQTASTILGDNDPNGVTGTTETGDSDNDGTASLTQATFSITIQDNGRNGPSFSAYTNMPSITRTYDMNYSFSAQQDGYLFVGGAGNHKVSDTENYIFRSQIGKFSMFNWAQDYLVLPYEPRALAGFNGRLYAFTRSKSYRINPQSLVVEDEYEGIGCLAKECVLTTEFGMFYADYNGVYMHDGQKPTTISNPIYTASSIELNRLCWKNLDFDIIGIPLLAFDASRKTLMCIFKHPIPTQNKSMIWAYSLPKNRWDLWSGDRIIKAVTPGKDGELLISDGQLSQFSKSERYRDFEYHSKKITMDRGSLLKNFNKVRTIGSDNVTTTYKTNTSATGIWNSVTDEAVNRSYKKANWIKLRFNCNGLDSKTSVDSYGIIYRPGRVK